MRTRLLVTLAYLSVMPSMTRAQSPIAANQTVTSAQESLIIGASQAVLLKKTDRILIGSVRANGAFIEIEISDQSRVSIPRDQVDFIGNNAEDVYQFKRRSIGRWATGDHFKLTRWCLQNQLLGHATEHYLEVAKKNADYPPVKRLAAELEQKILADENFRVYAGLPPLIAAQPQSGLISNANSKVIPASTSAVYVEHPEIALRFNDRVQPILLNRCSQAACHGVASHNSLRLIEPVGKAFVRVSSENLKHVLTLIKPDASGTPKILSFATKPHGLQREPGIAISETALLEELKNWIRFTENPVVAAVATRNSVGALTDPAGSGRDARGPLVATHDSVAVPAEAASKLNPIAPGSSPLRAVPTTANQVEFPSGTVRPATSEIDALDAQLNQILAKEKSLPGAYPRDPFDPAMFNRQAKPLR